MLWFMEYVHLSLLRHREAGSRRKHKVMCRLGVEIIAGKLSCDLWAASVLIHYLLYRYLESGNPYSILAGWRRKKPILVDIPPPGNLCSG